MVSLKRKQRRQTKRRVSRRIRRYRTRGGNNQVQLDVIFANDSGSMKVTKGQQLERSQVQTAPDFKIKTAISNSQTPNHYTLIMWDPDVPTASQPAWAHYIVTDINPNRQRGITLLDYMPPSPPSGIHRYFFTLYKQAASLAAAVDAIPQRPNFDLAAFVAANQLQKAAETYIKVAA